MKKNKRLKKELLLYKKEVVLKLNEYILNKQNKEELSNLIGDISLTNEIISVLQKIKNMETSFKNLMDFPMGSEFIPNSFYKDCLSTQNYYQALLNEVLKRKFNSKVLKIN